MKITILTMFPEVFNSINSYPLIARAINRGNLELKIVDIKDYAAYVGITMLMKGLTVSPLKLQKILYYEQAWHMVGFGRDNQLFSCAPQAWVVSVQKRIW